MFGDLQIIVNPNLIIGYKQARKHKKRRINKKWAKKYGNKPVWDDRVYMMGNYVIMSPLVYNKMEAKYDFHI